MTTSLSENGAVQLSSSGESRVDLFFNAVRSTPPERMESLVKNVLCDIFSHSHTATEKSFIAAADHLFDNCVACTAGKYLEASDNRIHHDSPDDCHDCPQGTYLEDRGTLASRHDNVTDCANCSAGTASSALGLSVECGCLNCKPGEYAAVPGQASCSACPVGQFQDGVGQTN